MPRAMAPASPERKKKRRTRPAAASAGAQEALQQHGTPAVKAEVHSPLPATHSVARGDRGLSACSDGDEGSDGGDDGPFTPAVTGGDGMRSAVPKTIANPLYGTSRREFRRVVSGMRGSGEGIFGIIDDDIARILEAVSRLAETAYDSYNKAAKRIITAGTAALAGRANSAQARGQEAHPHHHATPQGDPSALAHAIAMGNQAKEVGT